MGSFREQIHSHAQTAIAAQFHKNSGMEHGDGRGGRGMTIRRPGVKRKDGAKDTKA